MKLRINLDLPLNLQEFLHLGGGHLRQHFGWAFYARQQQLVLFFYVSEIRMGLVKHLTPEVIQLYFRHAWKWVRN